MKKLVWFLMLDRQSIHVSCCFSIRMTLNCHHQHCIRPPRGSRPQLLSPHFTAERATGQTQKLKWLRGPWGSSVWVTVFLAAGWQTDQNPEGGGREGPAPWHRLSQILTAAFPTVPRGHGSSQTCPQKWGGHSWKSLLVILILNSKLSVCCFLALLKHFHICIYLPHFTGEKVETPRWGLSPKQ